jgi:hypothetical protein
MKAAPSLLSRLSISTSSNNNNENDEAEFVSSFLYEGTFEGISSDTGLLNYLPFGGENMPPKTRQLINRITSDYIYGVSDSNSNKRIQQKVNFRELLEFEYDILHPAFSMAVANTTFEGATTSPEEQLVVCVASMAVLYQLPKEITLQLMQSLISNNNVNSESKALSAFVTAFQRNGWDDVIFPQGLAIRLKKGFTTTKGSDGGLGQFFPASRLPWRSRSTRRAAEAAERGVLAAAETNPPPRNVMTKEQFLVEIENEITSPLFRYQPVVMEPVAVLPLLVEDALPSFPTYRYGLAWARVKRAVMTSSNIFTGNKAWIKVSSTMDTQYTKLKGAGRAGLLAYAFLNFCLYTVGMSWQWRRTTLEVPSSGGSPLVSMVLKKFAKVFMTVYVGAAVFKLVRIVASLALAPGAGRVLHFTQRKLKVSENTAVAILITLLMKTFLGTLTIVCLGDSALRKALSSVAPQPTLAL